MKRVVGALAGLAFGMLMALCGGVPQASAEDFKQIKLSDDVIERYFALQKDLVALEPPEGTTMDKKKEAELKSKTDAAIKKHKFASAEEFEDVVSNINFALSYLDPETGEMTTPAESYKKQMEYVKKDDGLSAEEKKNIIADMEADLKALPELKFKENVDVVKKHRTRFFETAQAPDAPAKK